MSSSTTSSSSSTASAIIANPTRDVVLTLGKNAPWESFPQYLSSRDVAVIKRFSSEPASRLQELLTQGATRSLTNFTSDQVDARYYPRALLKVR